MTVQAHSPSLWSKQVSHFSHSADQVSLRFSFGTIQVSTSIVKKPKIYRISLQYKDEKIVCVYNENGSPFTHSFLYEIVSVSGPEAGIVK